MVHLVKHYLVRTIVDFYRYGYVMLVKQIIIACLPFLCVEMLDSHCVTPASCKNTQVTKTASFIWYVFSCGFRASVKNCCLSSSSEFFVFPLCLSSTVIFSQDLRAWQAYESVVLGNAGGARMSLSSRASSAHLSRFIRPRTLRYSNACYADYHNVRHNNLGHFLQSSILVPVISLPPLNVERQGKRILETLNFKLSWGAYSPSPLRLWRSR